MRVPDEGKLPVSWLAGNQGEYATSTEVNQIESFVILNVKTIFCEYSRDGRPVPRGTLPAGKGGFPAPPRAVGRGGSPAPPRPVKMIKTAGKLRGKINTRISTFSKRGKK